MVCRRCYGFLSVRLDTQFSPPISGDEGPSQVSKNQPGINWLHLHSKCLFAEQFFVSCLYFLTLYLINWISEVMDPSMYSNKYKFLYNNNDLISFKIGKHSHNLLSKANVKAIQASKLDSNALSNPTRLSDDDDNCLYWILEEWTCTTFPAFFDFIVNCRHIMLLLSFEVKFSSHLFIVCNTSDW